MPIVKKLHPTLKACKCGYIGTKSQFYNHMDYAQRMHNLTSEPVNVYHCHGEVPLNEDDPRTKVGEQLKESLKQ